MIMIGVDFHPEFQQIASLDTDTGEFQEKRLAHREEAENFYGALALRGQPVRVGMEASGHGHWFERLLAELHFELWIGDAAEVALARKLAVRLYWMWCKQWDYQQLRKFGSHAGQPESCNGVQ